VAGCLDTTMTPEDGGGGRGKGEFGGGWGVCGRDVGRPSVCVEGGGGDVG
jgi:hypothetical protein